MRWDIINYLVEKNGYTNYLEIGVQDYNSCCAKINTPNKTAVDPAPRNQCDFVGTSDAFFAQLDPNVKYDIVFVDGLHQDEQVTRDIENSLKHLTDNGTIVVHDCLPNSEQEAQHDDWGGPWMGTTFMSMVKFSVNKSHELQTDVVDHDCGCGIIRKVKNDLAIGYDIGELNFSTFSANKQQWLNIISLDDFYTKYAEPFFVTAEEIKEELISDNVIVEETSVEVPKAKRGRKKKTDTDGQA